MKPAFKFTIIALVFGAILAGGWYLKTSGALDKLTEKVAPEGRQAESILDKKTAESVKAGDIPLVTVCIVQWGGYAGGQYFNGGFKASTDSRYYKEYGMLVEFLQIEEFTTSRNTWKAGKCQVIWITADSFVTEAGSLPDNPKVFFQADWSRGGDAIVVKHDINAVRDLKGKKVAVALGTPSHTFLLMMLRADELEYKDVQIVGVDSAPTAALNFKNGVVDAALVWSPDDEDCVRSVPGAKVLKSTKEATNIIADVFFAKAAWLDNNPKLAKGLVEGWLRGAAEINSSASAKEEAIKILMAGLNIDRELATNAINNVRLATYGDNVNFFNLKGNYQGVTGENLYTKMGGLFTKVNFISGGFPGWRQVINTSVLNSITLGDTGANAAETAPTFEKAREADKVAPAFSSKALTVTFPSGSSVLDENARVIIDLGFADVVRAFAGARVRIEGHTDSVGGREANVRLSQARAQAVADYLVSKYQFDSNRFVVVGYGPDKPVADNQTAEGKAKNRRTEFQLLN